MKKKEMVEKIKNCIDENIDAQSVYRERHIRETVAALHVSKGTLDTCLRLKSLMDDENTLRRTYDDKVQWILALETIINKIEETLDQCLYEIDYEMITAYNVRLIINDAIAFHLQHEKSASRELEQRDKDHILNCRVRWGIAYLERKPEPGKWVSCNAADAGSLIRIIESVERAAKPHRYQ